MTLTTLTCPTCSAPIAIDPNATWTRCAYCQSVVQVDGGGRDRHLELVASIEENTNATHSEMRRIQLTQELTFLRARLASLDGEVRVLERSAPSSVVKKQLREVKSERESVLAQIADIELILEPISSSGNVDVAAASANNRPNWLRLLSLFLFPAGRIARSHFILGAGVLVLLFVVGNMIYAPGPNDEPSVFFGYLVLAIMYSYMCLGVKRYHDFGKSGLWILIAFIPLAVFYQWYELIVRASEDHANSFGTKPAQGLSDLRRSAAPAKV